MAQQSLCLLHDQFQKDTTNKINNNMETRWITTMGGLWENILLLQAL
jgi:hypothetical protein